MLIIKYLYANSIIKACKDIISYDLVRGTWGNISLRNKNNIYITPSGYPYEKITINDILVIDFQGKIIEGRKKVSSEWKMHRDIYLERPDISFILHTHPIYSSIGSVSFKSIPSLIEDSAMICGKEILVTEYKDPGSDELALEVSKKIKNNNAVIVKNHGLVTTGSNYKEALAASLICEKNIKIYIEALKINTNISLISEDKLNDLRYKYLNYYKIK